MTNKKNNTRQSTALSDLEIQFVHSLNSISDLREINKYEPKGNEEALYCLIAIVEAALNNVGRHDRHYFSVLDWEIRIIWTGFSTQDLPQILGWAARYNLKIEIKLDQFGNSYPILCKETIEPVRISTYKYLTAFDIAKALLFLAGRGRTDSYFNDKCHSVSYLVNKFNTKKLGVLNLFELEEGPQLTGELGDWV